MTSHSKKIILLTALAALLANPAEAQIRAGAAYLKIMPGTRQQTLAASTTGALDEMYSLYANPAAAGFLREWQWSASYSDWIADISNLSLTYGRQLRWRTPFANKINVAFGVNYQGVDEFDATRGAQPPASANDLLLTASLAVPLRAFSNQLALGANFKYLRSELAQFHASSAVFDVGILYRTPRLRLPFLFDYGILSAGAAATQFGRALHFAATETPLPKTLRAGLALNLGSHDGVQMQLSADYHDVRHEVSQFSFGVEITNLLKLVLPEPLNGSLGRILALRGGYTVNDRASTELVNKWAFGLSVRLDDYMNFSRASERRVFPSQNSAFRFDYGTIDSEFYDAVQLTSVTYRPLAPERFEFVRSDWQSFEMTQPPAGSYTMSDSVSLQWHAAVDPDLFDDVNYLLLVAKDDRALLNPFIEQAEQNQIDPALLREFNHFDDRSRLTQVRAIHLAASDNGNVSRDTTFYVASQSPVINYSRSGYFPGDYYWMALAYDRNHHFRAAETAGSRVARFHVKGDPDLTIQITNIRTEGEQNFADVLLINTAKEAVDDSFSVTVKSFSAEEFAALDVIAAGRRDIAGPPVVESDSLSAIEIKSAIVADTTFWFTAMGKDETLVLENIPLYPARPFLLAVVDLEKQIDEIDEFNNADIKTFTYYDLAVTKTPAVSPIRLDVQFEINDSSLVALNQRRDFNNQLALLGRALEALDSSDVFLKIDGHSDEQGFVNKRTGKPHSRVENEALNLKLSEGRARSARTFLAENYRIGEGRLCAVGYGQSQPLKRNAKTRAEHALNRRIEAALLKKPIPCSRDSVDSDLILPTLFQSESFAYEITVRNAGPHDAQNVIVTDMLSEYVSIVNIDANPKVMADTKGSNLEPVFWIIPQLAAGEMVNILYTVRVDSIPANQAIHQITSDSYVAADYDFNLADNSYRSKAVYAIGWRAPSEDITAAPDDCRRKHTVKNGENLWNITKQYYGDPRRWQGLYHVAANRERIGANPDYLRVGMELCLPEQPPTAVSPRSVNGGVQRPPAPAPTPPVDAPPEKQPPRGPPRPWERE